MKINLSLSVYLNSNCLRTSNIHLEYMNDTIRHTTALLDTVPFDVIGFTKAISESSRPLFLYLSIFSIFWCNNCTNVYFHTPNLTKDGHFMFKTRVELTCPPPISIHLQYQSSSASYFACSNLPVLILLSLTIHPKIWTNNQK